jgi:hypothetical protein
MRDKISFKSYSTLHSRMKKKDDLILFDCVSVANIRRRSKCMTCCTSVWNHLISKIVPF